MSQVQVSFHKQSLTYIPLLATPYRPLETLIQHTAMLNSQKIWTKLIKYLAIVGKVSLKNLLDVFSPKSQRPLEKIEKQWSAMAILALLIIAWNRSGRIPYSSQQTSVNHNMDAFFSLMQAESEVAIQITINNPFGLKIKDPSSFSRELHGIILASSQKYNIQFNSGQNKNPAYLISHPLLYEDIEYPNVLEIQFMNNNPKCQLLLSTNHTPKDQGLSLMQYLNILNYLAFIPGLNYRPSRVQFIESFCRQLNQMLQNSSKLSHYYCVLSPDHILVIDQKQNLNLKFEINLNPIRLIYFNQQKMPPNFKTHLYSDKTSKITLDKIDKWSLGLSLLCLISGHQNRLQFEERLENAIQKKTIDIFITRELDHIEERQEFYTDVIVTTLKKWLKLDVQQEIQQKELITSKQVTTTTKSINASANESIPIKEEGMHLNWLESLLANPSENKENSMLSQLYLPETDQTRNQKPEKLFKKDIQTSDKLETDSLKQPLSAAPQNKEREEHAIIQQIKETNNQPPSKKSQQSANPVKSKQSQKSAQLGETQQEGQLQEEQGKPLDKLAQRNIVEADQSKNLNLIRQYTSNQRTEFNYFNANESKSLTVFSATSTVQSQKQQQKQKSISINGRQIRISDVEQQKAIQQSKLLNDWKIYESLLSQTKNRLTNIQSKIKLEGRDNLTSNQAKFSLIAPLVSAQEKQQCKKIYFEDEELLKSMGYETKDLKDVVQIVTKEEYKGEEKEQKMSQHPTHDQHKALVKNSCGHASCLECYAKYLIEKFERQEFNNIKCIINNCEEHIEAKLLISLAKSNKKCEDLLLKKLMQLKDPSIKQCARKGCENTLTTFRYFEGNKIFYCNICTTYICPKCGLQFHGQLPCQLLETKKKGMQDYIEQEISQLLKSKKQNRKVSKYILEKIVKQLKLTSIQVLEQVEALLVACLTEIWSTSEKQQFNQLEEEGVYIVQDLINDLKRHLAAFYLRIKKANSLTETQLKLSVQPLSDSSSFLEWICDYKQTLLYFVCQR